MKKRISNKDKLSKLNKLLVETEKMKLFTSSSEFYKSSEKEQLEYIREVKQSMQEVEDLNKEIYNLLEYAPELSNKLYLSEIIEKDKPKFSSNNLILAPVGSGKTTLIKNHLIKNAQDKVLMLVSSSALKEKLAPDDNVKRKELSNSMYTTKNKSCFGDLKIHLMTYSEFGERVYVNNEFLDGVHQIFCDEIHSLPEYISYGGSDNGGLIHAQKILFNKHEGKEIYYFTATKENLVIMESNRPGTLEHVKTFDYLEHPEIMQYKPIMTREINNINQIRQYLKDRKDGFKFYNYKGFAFSKTISSLKKIEKIVREEGFNPLVLWSENNKDYKLDESQLEAKKSLLSNDKIPEPYDFLIFNSAFQEGWDLKDNSVKLAIMNTTNNTEYIQALGRLRRDVDLLIYRSETKSKIEGLSIPGIYINKLLTKEEKEELCVGLNIIGRDGEISKWETVKKLLLKNNYNVEDKSIRIDGKVTRVSIINIK